MILRTEQRAKWRGESPRPRDDRVRFVGGPFLCVLALENTPWGATRRAPPCWRQSSDDDAPDSEARDWSAVATAPPVKP